MIKRFLEPYLEERLTEVPAVTLLGPRQVGKTTLSLAIAKNRPSIYLDLESDSDRAKLLNPELYLNKFTNSLVILDEVQRFPNLFQSLRGLIDRGRRGEGLENGRFLLLGSASLDLLQQSSETLAGRISFMELLPIQSFEVPLVSQDTIWERGGFPKSLLAANEQQSTRWRVDFIKSYLERDIPQLGPHIPAETLRRFWTMLAHCQGCPFNAAQLAASLGVTGKTVSGYLDLLVDLLLVRRLSPWHSNAGKRLVRAPKVYIRDSGIVHTLLGLTEKEDILAHPIVGQSWEGFIIETLLDAAPQLTEASYYRTSAGAEIDLILALPKNRLWAIEIKRSLNPKPRKGFHFACEDIKPERSFVVYAGVERYSIADRIDAISVLELAKMLRDL